MAERRMIAKTIVDSDAFLEMPISSQCLYFHLSVRADDDGFINSPKTIMKMVGAKEDDMRVLALRKFIIPFDSGIVVIKHWKIHNYIQNDRRHETKYKGELSMLELDENKAYRLAEKPMYPECIQDVSEMEAEVRLGKDSIDKVNKDSSHFVPPTPEDVRAYCTERNNHVDADKFIDFYTSKGWMVGKSKMKDWKASVRTWEKDDKPNKKPEQPRQNKFNNHDQRPYTPEYYADLEKKLYGKGL